jgi:UrcA family protein
MTMNRRRIASAIGGSLAVAVLIGTASPAAARDVKVVAHRSSDIQVERVSYADLDLTSKRGVRKLNARVDGAVSRVCFAFDYIDSETKANCRSYAWNGAKPQIALATQRANELAQTGFSTIAPVAIRIALPN